MQATYHPTDKLHKQLNLMLILIILLAAQQMHPHSVLPPDDQRHELLFACAGEGCGINDCVQGLHQRLEVGGVHLASQSTLCICMASDTAR